MLGIVVLVNVAVLIWFFPAPSLVGPLPENGVAMIVACGEKRSFEYAMKHVPDPRGEWTRIPRGDCTAWYRYLESSSGG